MDPLTIMLASFGASALLVMTTLATLVAFDALVARRKKARQNKAETRLLNVLQTRFAHVTAHRDYCQGEKMFVDLTEKSTFDRQEKTDGE